MKFLRGFVIGLLLTSILHAWMLGWGDWYSLVKGTWNQVVHRSIDPGESDRLEEHGSPLTRLPIESEEGTSTLDSEQEPVPTEQLQVQLGMKKEQILEILGEPVRMEPSAYGYEWWIYNQNWEEYIQIGIDGDQVVTYYTNAPSWSWSNIYPGMEYEAWNKQWEQKEEISFHYDLGYYTFTLSELDLQERPLFVEDATAVQLYIDQHDEYKVSGLRVMDLKTLLLHRPYAFKYVGKLPDLPEYESSMNQKIALANERQILDIINVTRNRFELGSLTWHEEAANVARGHSQDMFDHQFFDHVSPNTGDLAQRLAKGEVSFRSAGENIAWNYVDAADAHEGWMNSLGHRKNVMEENYTHLGVGVIEKYFTQNFVTP